MNFITRIISEYFMFKLKFDRSILFESIAFSVEVYEYSFLIFAILQFYIWRTICNYFSKNIL